MKIRMLQTVQGTLDGLTVGRLEVGSEYDTADTPRGIRVAAYHVKQGVAEYVRPAAKVAPVSLKRKAA